MPAGVKLSGPHMQRTQRLLGNDKQAALLRTVPHKDKQQASPQSAVTFLGLLKLSLARGGVGQAALMHHRSP